VTLYPAANGSMGHTERTPMSKQHQGRENNKNVWVVCCNHKPHIGANMDFYSAIPWNGDISNVLMSDAHQRDAFSSPA